jgi:hypothetical protein
MSLKPHLADLVPEETALDPPLDWVSSAFD